MLLLSEQRFQHHASGFSFGLSKFSRCPESRQHVPDLTRIPECQNALKAGSCAGVEVQHVAFT